MNDAVENTPTRISDQLLFDRVISLFRNSYPSWDIIENEDELFEIIKLLNLASWVSQRRLPIRGYHELVSLNMVTTSATTTIILLALQVEFSLLASTYCVGATSHALRESNHKSRVILDSNDLPTLEKVTKSIDIPYGDLAPLKREAVDVALQHLVDQIKLYNLIPTFVSLTRERMKSNTMCNMLGITSSDLRRVKQMAAIEGLVSTDNSYREKRISDVFEKIVDTQTYSLLKTIAEHRGVTTPKALKIVINDFYRKHHSELIDDPSSNLEAKNVPR